jgi:3-dehydro-L-gulonate 2-dehydrogenase
MEIARQFGIGSVCLGHTNHWMRGGTYGWRAARAGFVFISWTNTIANMPPWGSEIPKLGNNPLVFAVPYGKEAIVLDMAMSQFSFGALELQKFKGKKLSVIGGFDTRGELTTDPEEILKTNRALPIGYWKGAGLSLLLDILGTILSGGLSVKQISQQSSEINVSQVFIAIDISKLKNFSTINETVKNIIDDYHSSPDGVNQVVFPGERVLALRLENSKNGIPVFKNIWDEIRGLSN